MNLPPGLNPNIYVDPYRVSGLTDLMSRIGLACADLSTLLFAINAVFFRRPGTEWNKRPLPAVSVLIPARNEELTIGAAIAAVRHSRGVELEVVVLDDGSTDGTAAIVQAAAEKDRRVRLEKAPALPEGWNGKQHACWVLAGLASYDVFCYLDADVRVGQEAIYRMVSELNLQQRKRPERAMVSGFPRQETKTFLEKLLLPLIHFILLTFLPLPAERWTRWPAFAVGCGQFMMVRRGAYFESGGHSAIRSSMHDGLQLPKLFRRHGFRTLVYDLSRDATCRMYGSGGAVWRGLEKNATEGMASPLRLPVFTLLLVAGQVLPLALLGPAVMRTNPLVVSMILLAMGWSYGVRAIMAWRYRQNWMSVLLHPLGVLVLVALQWWALLRKLVGAKSTWKERAYRLG